VSLLFGTVFAVCVPINAAPDEPVHMYRAYEVAHGHFISQKVDGQAVVEIPKSLVETGEKNAEGKVIHWDPTVRTSLSQTADLVFNTPLNKHDTEVVNTALTSSYSPIAHLPQAVAVIVGETVNMSPGGIFMLARLLTLLVRTALGVLAVWLWRDKQWGLAALLLLPMAVAQSAVLGGDAMSIGLSALFISLALYLRRTAERGPIGWLKVAGLAGLAGAVALTKPGVVVCVGALLVVPAGRLLRRFGWAAKAGIILFAGMCALGWLYVASQGLSAGYDDGVSRDSSFQFSYLLHHPAMAFLLMTREFISLRGNDNIISFAGNFGAMDTPLPLGVAVPILICAAAYLLCYHGRLSVLPRRTRVFLLVVAVGFVWVTALGMYIVGSEPGAPTIWGLQGRYFLPVLPLLLPVMPALAKMTRRWYMRLVRIMPVAWLVISLVYVINRYYQTPLYELLLI
jgi:uncharacterized membrane protein